MKVTYLTLLILQVNSLIDSGKYSDISIEDIHEAIEEKRVLRFLKERVGKDIDLSLHLGETSNNGFEKFFENQLYQIYGGYAGQERRKWGVSNFGLSLVLAWTNEIIQVGTDLEW